MAQNTVIAVVWFLAVIAGLLIPCNSLCSNGYTCLPKTECDDRHIFLKFNTSSIKSCSAAEGYVCCPPSNSRRERNRMLLPIRNCGKIFRPIGFRALGGLPAEPKQFPWMALLGYTYYKASKKINYFCDGTLISKRYILTAAHCINSTDLGKLVHVRLGEVDRESELDCEEGVDCDKPIDIEIEDTIVHKKYNWNNFKNDIALLRLKTSINVTDFISPICLPFDITTERDQETNYTLAGWGKTKEGEISSEHLFHTDVPNVPLSKCNEKYSTFKGVGTINELQLCSGGTGKHEACQGDSGGPLMKNFEDIIDGTNRTYQIGIVSFGAAICGGKIPSVNTNVTGYLNWILDNLKP